MNIIACVEDKAKTKAKRVDKTKTIDITLTNEQQIKFTK